MKSMVESGARSISPSIDQIATHLKVYCSWQIPDILHSFIIFIMEMPLLFHQIGSFVSKNDLYSADKDYNY